MKKINVILCAFLACLLTACKDCGFTQGDPYTTYTWSYTTDNGTKLSGEFTTNEYGQVTSQRRRTSTVARRMSGQRRHLPQLQTA